MADFEQNKNPISTVAKLPEIGLEFSKRLKRYGIAKERSLAMSDYIRFSLTGTTKQRYSRLSYNLSECGSFLWFRNYFELNDVRLHSAKFCKKHLICPFCAIRRASKYIQAYLDKMSVINAEFPHLKPYMLTLTVKDGESLPERLNHLQTSIRAYMRKRREFLARVSSNRNRPHVELVKAFGGVFSIEVKRGKNSNLWHPHAHFIVMCDPSNPINAKKLSEEWQSITGDSFIVDCRMFYGDDVIDGFLEIFKYALKFSDMTLEDNWHAYEVVSGKRLIENFGILRGVKVDDNLNDLPLENEKFIDMFFQYFSNKGYVQVENLQD